MKIKYILIVSIAPFFFFMILFVAIIFMVSDSNSENEVPVRAGEMSLSEDVLAYESVVLQYAEMYGVQDYADYLLAIMQVESGGVGKDVMQSSESAGLEKNTLEPEASIQQGCFYFSQLLNKAFEKECDINTAVQAYNYGGGYIDYVSANEKQHTFILSENYAAEKSGNTKVKYSEPLAVKMNGGWRYKYGNMFYVYLIEQCLYVECMPGEDVQIVLDEAKKYEGWKYVFGGDSPISSFDCSGLVQWCYRQAGIEMPRTAQEQFDVTQRIGMEALQPGDLIFFHGTYRAGTYITHVGIYVGNGFMFHAGDPIGYADISKEYWQEHLAGAGRIIKK